MTSIVTPTTAPLAPTAPPKAEQTCCDQPLGTRPASVERPPRLRSWVAAMAWLWAPSGPTPSERALDALKISSFHR